MPLTSRYDDLSCRSWPRRATILAVFLAATACAESTSPDSYVGLWTGSNSVFTQFQLNFQAQFDDTAWGSGFFIFAQTASTVADTDFVARAVGDSLNFMKPVPSSTGYTSINFRGRRREAAIDGIVNDVPIVLNRH
jgi:hypothetical protein